MDRDYHPSKSLLHVLAQRLTRSSPARTNDQDCLSPSLMHLDVGEVDLASHIHVPAVSVQLHAPSDDLSKCTGHAAAVSHLEGLPLLGGMIASGGFGNRMCHVSLAPLTWRGLPPGLVGPQLLDATQMQWSSAGSGTEARHAQSPTKTGENCPNCSISDPSSTRHAPVESESLPEICNPMPDANSGVMSEKV